jgi:formate hydrogenlyase transcriptional activator
MAPGGNMQSDLLAREREAIESALLGSRGRVAGSNGAAARLGIPASTLESRIKRLGIDKFRFRNSKALE